ncbi:serine hydrolase [Rhodococcus chondri]|uniref:Beta-lactamase class A catalytic domain-containing protein n=1 Tax=Rhodococcus chondri TaxID=3065941 RepID=A0ABU7JUU3_9NOCA|nr:serine hydrolase [Rhodococcus sp. CC-R104]MEE2033786.1 hypothetical protein [Rhodococcus sp. CC-R104]
MTPGRRGRARPKMALLFVAATVVACAAPAVGASCIPAGAGSGLAVQAAATSPIEMSGLGERIATATEAAAERGAHVTFAVLDRDTGARTIGGTDESIETASVVKLFIADDVLFREGLGDITLTAEDYDLIEHMLRSSDDSAAGLLWERHGGPEIVDRVVERHSLTGTTAPANGWWNTTTTASDLLTWYDALLSGDSGLDDEATARLVGHLMNFTPAGTDGYDQRFGLPDGLPAATDPGVKQGWMCCLDEQWIHLSTGFFGEDHRYVVAVLSREAVTYGEDSGREEWFLPDTALHDVTGDESAQHARDTMTAVVEAVFGGTADE